MSDAGRVVYEVTAIVELAVAMEYERYMLEDHIPDLLATGCFVSASLARAAGGRYNARYESAAQADLDDYFARHADRLRAEVSAHFPEGISFDREVWEVLRTL